MAPLLRCMFNCVVLPPHTPPHPHLQWVFSSQLSEKMSKSKSNLCNLNQAEKEDGETLQRTAAAAGGENTQDGTIFFLTSPWLSIYRSCNHPDWCQGVKIPDPLPGFPSRMCSPFIRQPGVTSTRLQAVASRWMSSVWTILSCAFTAGSPPSPPPSIHPPILPIPTPLHPHLLKLWEEATH